MNAPTPSPWSLAVQAAVSHDLEDFSLAIEAVATLVQQHLPVEAAESCGQLLVFARAKALGGDWAEAAHILRYLRRCWREGMRKAEQRQVYRAA